MPPLTPRRFRQVPYDFTYFPVQFPVDVTVLSLSTAPSLLPFATHPCPTPQRRRGSIRGRKEWRTSCANKTYLRCREWQRQRRLDP